MGISLASVFYQSSTQPIESTLYYLDSITGSSDPVMIYAHLSEIQANLNIIIDKIPETTNTNHKIVSKSPVWMYPTESTNFLRIQNDVNTMIKSAEKLSSVPKDISAHNAGIMDISNRAFHLRDDVLDAAPYIYNTPEYILSNSIWLIGVMGMTETLLGKRSHSSNNL